MDLFEFAAANQISEIQSAENALTAFEQYRLDVLRKHVGNDLAEDIYAKWQLRKGEIK